MSNNLKNDIKAVIIIDGALSTGLIANTAAILGVTLGKLAPEYVGHDVTDASGRTHPGIITIPVPVLMESCARLQSLRNALFAEEYSGLTIIDFSDVAQGCKAYDEYTRMAAQTEGREYTYLGVAILGDRKKVNRLTGNMLLLR